MKNIEDYRLCYIKNVNDTTIIKLYFTELQDVTKQWGDDWDDIPYEHNAEPPYENDYDSSQIKLVKGIEIYPKIDIYKMFLVSKSCLVNIYTPCANTLNSCYSVKNINDKVVPWLTIVKDKEKEFVYAGTTVSDFIKIIQKYKDDIDLYFKYDLK